MRMQKDILTHPKCEFSDIFCDVPLSIQAKTLWDGYIKHSTAETSSFVCLGQACENKEEAEATIAHYLRMDGTKAHFKEVNGKFMVYRDSDNKTLKSVNYSPVNLQPILDCNYTC